MWPVGCRPVIAASSALIPWQKNEAQSEPSD
jgi:hypothetical protein